MKISSVVANFRWLLLIKAIVVGVVVGSIFAIFGLEQLPSVMIGAAATGAVIAWSRG